MKVKCKTRNPITGEIVTYQDTLNDKADYVRIRASMVSSSEAFINDYQIVKNGYITEDAYNNADAIINKLLNG